MDDTVAITLFRHGMTEENKRKAYIGWNDSPLCKEAVRMLSKHASDGASHDLYMTSDLQRCVTTMDILFPDVKPIVWKELREMNFGTFEGQTYIELKNAPSYQQWLRNMMTASPPNGESFEQFSERVLQGWEKLIQTIILHGSKKPFIVTHSGVIRYLLMRFAPTKKEYWDWHINYYTKYVMVFDLKKLRRKERCILLQEEPLTEKEHGC